MKPLIANALFFAQVEELIASGREVELRVKGYSMRPLLRNEREKVVLRAHDGAELQPGAIVLFRYRGRHVLHRIVRREGDRLTLAGDGNYRVEEHCSVGDVVAIARAVIRPDGRTVACDSPEWRRRSRRWLALPPLVRRYVLAVLFRLGYR